MNWGKIGARKMIHHGPVLPSGARWVEYLESTPTQWIDTGIVPTYATKVECTFSTTQDIATSNRNYIFGADSLARGIQFSYSPTAFFSAGGLYDNTYSLSVDRNRHKIVVEQSKFYLDGTLVFTGGNNYTTTLPLALFADSSSSTPSLWSYARIYRCDIYGNGSLIRSFRPIAIGNKGYMLDLVTGDYLQYGNKGEGEFVIGPTIAYPERERESKQLFGLIFHFDNFSTNNIFESDFALSYLKEAA